ncbi:MAG: response regulator transcription factor [Sulfurimonadaceae bacterium]|nr:response regulator transcription factor [Sulfurimonadaceae bacterium]
MKATILIVEDETDLLELLEYRLGMEGYETVGFLNTKFVKQALQEENIDLILMDRNLPDIEGSEFVAMLREQGVETPVIYLTAKDSKFHIQEGFLRGADDYITKPFEMEELLMRIGAVLRRTKTMQQSKKLTFRDIELDLNARHVMIDHKPVELTKLEFELLRTFIDNQNTVLTREFLLKHVWEKNDNYQGRTVNVAINRLKEKVDPEKEKDYIKTVRGVGYTIQ